jgi:hypothetical protein
MANITIPTPQKQLIKALFLKNKYSNGKEKRNKKRKKKRNGLSPISLFI